MNIYSKPPKSKHYVSYFSNHPKSYIPFYLAIRICKVVENENVRHMKLKELRTILKTQKYLKMVVEKGIEKALAIHQEKLRNGKLKNNDNILRFTSTYDANNSNDFPKVREMYRNLQKAQIN